VFIIGIDYLRTIGGEYYGGVPISVTASGYLIVVLGLGGIIYGAKRLIDDVIKATR